MQKSLCYMAPAATLGARRRICIRCRKSWTVRPKRRGRKKKRARTSLAISAIKCGSSLRALAEQRSINRETLRRRFHVSLKTWLRKQVVPALPETGSLIALVDALWFKLGKHKTPYTCFTILLRPIDSAYAVVATLTLLKGKESQPNWERVLKKIPKDVKERILAIIADGFTGMITIAKNNGWPFQWCHVHMKRRISELRGVRNLPGKKIRQRVTRLVYEFLETPDDKQAAICLNELRNLFALPECPKSITKRLSGIIKRSHLFRTYRAVPELSLPVSTNSVEQVHNQIRRLLGQTRGLRSLQSLQYWIRAIHRSRKLILCRGYKDTIKYYRKSVS